MHEAKTHLSRLVGGVANGTEPEIVIAVGRNPVARLVPYGAPPKRPLGIDEGLFTVPDDFDAPDPEIERLFNGNS